jgi:hypothetical protein
MFYAYFGAMGCIEFVAGQLDLTIELLMLLKDRDKHASEG